MSLKNAKAVGALQSMHCVCTAAEAAAATKKQNFYCYWQQGSSFSNFCFCRYDGFLMYFFLVMEIFLNHLNWALLHFCDERYFCNDDCIPSGVLKTRQKARRGGKKEVKPKPTK